MEKKQIPIRITDELFQRIKRTIHEQEAKNNYKTISMNHFIISMLEYALDEFDKVQKGE